VQVDVDLSEAARDNGGSRGEGNRALERAWAGRKKSCREEKGGKWRRTRGVRKKCLTLHKECIGKEESSDRGQERLVEGGGGCIKRKKEKRLI